MPVTAVRSKRRLVAELSIAVTTALLTLNIEKLSVVPDGPIFAFIQQCMTDVLFPGVLISFAFSGNVHAWPLWLAALGNFVFYLAVIHIGVLVYHKIQSSRNSLQ